MKNNCTHRIKPFLIRDAKTEALLVFIRTTLEQRYSKENEKGFNSLIGTQEQINIIEENLEFLYNNLAKHIVNANYLHNLLNTKNINSQTKMLIKKEEPLMIYYDCIIKELMSNLSSGQKWIPEVIIICVLSEWILEEEKSIDLYPFLNKLDYIKLVELFDNVKLQSEIYQKEVIMDMYRLSTKIIKKLKDSSYKNKRYKKRKL